LKIKALICSIQEPLNIPSRLNVENYKVNYQTSPPLKIP
jgi:hypothetical protein